MHHLGTGPEWYLVHVDCGPMPLDRGCALIVGVHCTEGTMPAKNECLAMVQLAWPQHKHTLRAEGSQGITSSFMQQEGVPLAG